MSSELVLLTKTKYEADIISWVEHHLACGFDHILIFDNESCTDLSKLLSKYNKVQVVPVKGWPNQLGLYQKAREKCPYDWQLFIDDDEFLDFDKSEWKDVNTFLNSIPSYISQYGIFWQFMSSKTFEKERADYSIPVNKYYNYTTDENYRSHYKTFVRNTFDGVYLTPHYCYPKSRMYRVMTEIGAMTDMQAPWFFGNPMNHKIKLRHYYLQSEKELMIKLTEKLPDHPEGLTRNKDTLDKAVDLKYNVEVK